MVTTDFWPLAAEHQRDGGAGQGVGRAHVEAERLLEIVGVGVEEGVGDGATDVVDDRVEPAELVVRRLSQPGRGVEVAQVGGYDERPAAGRLDPVGDLDQLRLVPRRDDDVGTRLGECERRGRTDAAACAGHDRDWSVSVNRSRIVIVDQAAAGDEREVERGDQPALRRDHSRDGVDQPLRGHDHPRDVVVPDLTGSGLTVVAELQLHHRLAGHHDLVATATAAGLRPLRRLLLGRPRHVLEHHAGHSVDTADDLESDGGHGPGRNVDARGLDVLIVCPPVDGLGQRLVESEPEAGGDLADDAAPRHREDARLPEHRGLLR